MVFQTEVSGLVLDTEVIDMFRGIFVLNLMPIAAVEVFHLLGISRVSSKESRIPLPHPCFREYRAHQSVPIKMILDEAAGR